MQCSSCNALLAADAKACPTCGASRASACGQCGFPHVSGGRFCPGCGRLVSAPPTQSGSVLAYLHSSVPASLVERVRRSANAMLGELKHVTVLFADIRGSTSLVDSVNPEQALEIIAPAMQVMMDAVHRHDGIVNQTRGDGLMALFGAPLAIEDHAVRACRAAQGMVDAIGQLASRPARPLSIRVGLHSGQVVIHSIGSDLAMHYEATGRTTHVAARMEQLAAPGQVLMTGTTYQLSQGFIAARPLGPMALKGIADAVDAYELTAVTESSRWQVRSARGVRRMVGREAELRVVGEAIERAATGRGGAVAIVGPPGIGKSRLAHEIITSLPAGWLALQGSCSPQLAQSSYSLIGDVIRCHLRAAGEAINQVDARLAEVRLAQLGPALAGFGPALLALLGFESDDVRWKRLAPPDRRLKVFEAANAFIARLAQDQPLLLLIEDLQWADAESRFIVENWAAKAADKKLLVITTLRPDGASALERSPPDLDQVEALQTKPDSGLAANALGGFARDVVTLSAFNPEEARDHIDQLLGDDISLFQIRRHILNAAQGNPLFIEEIVQDLRDRTAIEGPPRQVRLLRSDIGLELPASIHSVIAARIDYLAPVPKMVLQSCAVVGRDVSVALLSRMVELAEGVLADALQTLEAADFLHKTGGNSEVDYTFKHELTREVAYGSLMLFSRRQLHAKAVEIIEQTAGPRIDTVVDKLADHAFRGELWEKAVPYLMRSGIRAIKRAGNRDAVKILERGVEATSHLPDGDAKSQAAIDVRLALITPLEPLGRHRRIADVLKEASNFTNAAKDPKRAAAVNTQLSVALWRLGLHAQAMEVGEIARAVVEHVATPSLKFAAIHNVAIVHHETGNFAKAIELFRECIAMETPEIDAHRAGWAALPSVMLRAFLADALIETGHYEEAEALCADGARRPEEHAYSRTTIEHVYGRLRVEQGRAAEAVDLLERAWKRCLELEIVQYYPIIAARLCEACLAAGDVKRAAYVAAAPEKLDAHRSENAYAWSHLYLAQAQAHVSAGRISEAFEACERGLKLAESRGERPMQAHALKLLGRISHTIDDPAAAATAACFRAARQLAIACGMLPLANHCARELEQLGHDTP